jgi:hypothetical protein
VPRLWKDAEGVSRELEALYPLPQHTGARDRVRIRFGKTIRLPLFGRVYGGVSIPIRGRLLATHGALDTAALIIGSLLGMFLAVFLMTR